MPKKRGIRGRSLDLRAPEWEPILNLAPDHVDDFMWMYAVELADGTRVQVYKHYWTRNTIHLDGEGRAFAFREPDRYKEVEPAWLLSRVLMEDRRTREPDIFVRHNYAAEFLDISWTRSATKHRISRERSRHVVEHCGLRFWRRAPRRASYSGLQKDRVLFFGDDFEGIPIEVFGAMLPEGELLVIHAMELRDRYRGLYEEAKRWRC